MKNKIITFSEIIERFNKIIPAKMSDNWIEKLHECYKINPEKFINISKNLIYDHKYSIMMKNPSLIIPYGIYSIMMQEIEECYVNLVRTNKLNKIKKYKERRAERILDEQKYIYKKKLEQNAKIIGELYKNE